MFEVVISESEYVTSVNPIIVRTVYETMVLPKALYGCELWNTYSKQDINNLRESTSILCLTHASVFEKYQHVLFFILYKPCNNRNSYRLDAALRPAMQASV